MLKQCYLFPRKLRSDKKNGQIKCRLADFQSVSNKIQYSEAKHKKEKDKIAKWKDKQRDKKRDEQISQKHGGVNKSKAHAVMTCADPCDNVTNGLEIYEDWES